MGHLTGVTRRGYVGQQNRELVSRETRHRPDDLDRLGLVGEGELVAESHGCAQSARHFPEEVVSRRVAQAVVDFLEAIEVEEEQREIRATALGGCQRVAEESLEAPTVRKTCEAVVEGDGADTLLGELAFGDVAKHQHPTGEVALGIEQGRQLEVVDGSGRALCDFQLAIEGVGRVPGAPGQELHQAGMLLQREAKR